MLSKVPFPWRSLHFVMGKTYWPTPRFEHFFFIHTIVCVGFFFPLPSVVSQMCQLEKGPLNGDAELNSTDPHTHVAWFVGALALMQSSCSIVRVHLRCAVQLYFGSETSYLYTSSESAVFLYNKLITRTYPPDNFFACSRLKFVHFIFVSEANSSNMIIIQRNII